MGSGSRKITLRFMAAPTDVATLGGKAVAGGRVLEWIDKAAYACAVGWSGGYCVTAYVGNVNFARPIESGDVVEVEARLVHTGRSSMSIEVVVSSATPQRLDFAVRHLLHGHLRVGRGQRPADPRRAMDSADRRRPGT